VAFGQPDSINVNAVRNRYDTSSIDTIVTLRYRAAIYVFYAVTRSHGDILLQGVISDPRHLKRSPIQLGATVAEVRRFFNDASRGPSAHMIYSTDFSGTHTLELWFENDRLIRMRWVYPID
jgi:hypothetical protein